MFDKNIKALLVCDGVRPTVPLIMGKPREDQLIGTGFEILTETAGRGCYDSFGTGRDSKKFHEHLLDVRHWSVYEHAWVTVNLGPQTNGSIRDILLALINRPAIVVTYKDHDLRVTFNARHLLEWHEWTAKSGIPAQIGGWTMQRDLFEAFVRLTRPLMPQILQRLTIDETSSSFTEARIVPPEFEQEQFVSMYLSGSRGFSHEQVRHRFSMSQRSTRFCDETDSPWVEHPLTTQYFEETENTNAPSLRVDITGAMAACRGVYIRLVDQLQDFVKTKNPKLDNTSARKQARGAARGYLGNALFTEMIYTASVQSWQHMLKQRGTQFADAEIRVLYTDVLHELKASKYGSTFSRFNLMPSPDGLGQILGEHTSYGILPV